MNNFGKYITPKEAKEGSEPKKPLAHYEKMAKRKAKKCFVCGQFDEWKLAETGMCFTCTTGENDASDDCEIKETHEK